MMAIGDWFKPAIQKLMDAARVGEAKQVQRLLSKKPELAHSVDEETKLTALHVAATANQLDVARFLLDAGASANAGDPLTPTIMAVIEGHAEMADLLVKAGGDIGRSLYYRKYDVFIDVLMLTVIRARPDGVRLALALGIDPDIRLRREGATVYRSDGGISQVVEYPSVRDVAEGIVFERASSHFERIAHALEKTGLSKENANAMSLLMPESKIAHLHRKSHEEGFFGAIKSALGQPSTFTYCVNSFFKRDYDQILPSVRKASEARRAEEMGRYTLSCPHCGKKNLWKPEKAGRTIECLYCRSPFDYPRQQPSSRTFLCQDD